jgi:ribosomal protein L34
MRTLRGPSRTLKSLHRTVSTSDVPTVIRRHARVGFRIRPMRCPASSPCGDYVEFDLRIEGPSFAAPVRARRARARERLSSYRKPASFHPQAMTKENLNSHP